MAIDNSLNFKTNYILTFDKLPTVQFFCQDAVVPAINLSTTPVMYPKIDVPLQGDKLIFDPMTIGFLVDENMQNYGEVFDWMWEMRNPESDAGYNIFSDATLTVLSNNKNPVARFRFIDCIPTALDGLQFDTSADGTDPQLANLTLEFNYFKFERVTQ